MNAAARAHLLRQSARGREAEPEPATQPPAKAARPAPQRRQKLAATASEPPPSPAATMLLEPLQALVEGYASTPLAGNPGARSGRAGGA